MPATEVLRPQHVIPRRLFEAAALLGAAAPTQDAELTGISLDSRRVLPGDLYVALPGSATHGARFIDRAARLGAVAVVTDPEGAAIALSGGEPVVGRPAGEPVTVPMIVVPDPRAVLGRLSAWLYGEPARDLLLIGVTGTSGKTTTSYLLEAGLAAAGHTAGVIGTVGARVGGQLLPVGYTTPEAPDLHALFAIMRERGATACAMEVSSHALARGRVDGLVYDVAIFTNLGRDHLDFHPDLDDYFAAKSRLFTTDRARSAIVNVDDRHGARLAERVRQGGGLPLATFSSAGAPADWQGYEVVLDESGARFWVRGPGGQEALATVNLPGAFNVSNALAAIAGLVTAGVSLEQAVKGVAACPGVPGRMEPVDVGQPFLAIVDYAHKPDALAAVLITLRDLVSGRIIVVFGAGGERDQGKRPEMGTVVAERADVMVVTDDNPRGEDPATIRSAILAGATRLPGGRRATVHEVAGRREAIRLAVAQAGPGDAVLVAGKGHEQGQEVAQTVHPFDDREVLAEELRAVYG